MDSPGPSTSAGALLPPTPTEQRFQAQLRHAKEVALQIEIIFAAKWTDNRVYLTPTPNLRREKARDEATLVTTRKYLKQMKAAGNEKLTGYHKWNNSKLKAALQRILLRMQKSLVEQKLVLSGVCVSPTGAFSSQLTKGKTGAESVPPTPELLSCLVEAAHRDRAEPYDKESVRFKKELLEENRQQWGIIKKLQDENTKLRAERRSLEEEVQKVQAVVHFQRERIEALEHELLNGHPTSHLQHQWALPPPAQGSFSVDEPVFDFTPYL